MITLYTAFELRGYLVPKNGGPMVGPFKIRVKDAADERDALRQADKFATAALSTAAVFRATYLKCDGWRGETAKFI